MAKINVQEMVGKKIKSNSYGYFIVVSYIGKPQKDHMYKIKFVDTNNQYTVTRSSIMRKSCVDKTKKLSVKKDNAKKKIQYRKKLNRIKGKETIEFNGKNCRILSLDQSINGTACAYYIDEQLIHYGKIDTSMYDNYVEKIIHVRDVVSDMIDKHKIDVIAIEDIYMGFNVEVYKKLAILYGVIQILALEKKVKFISAVAYQWKESTGCLTGKRKAQKKKSIQRVNEIYGFNIDDDDIADSILIGRYVSKDCIVYTNKNLNDYDWG